MIALEAAEDAAVEQMRRTAIAVRMGYHAPEKAFESFVVGKKRGGCCGNRTNRV